MADNIKISELLELISAQDTTIVPVVDGGTTHRMSLSTLQTHLTASLATQSQISNIDNTSDVDKPVSTAQAEAIKDAKENLVNTVRNVSGATMPIGTPVRVVGATGENPNVEVANATSNGIPDRFNGDKNIVFGITTQNINNNAAGEVLYKGTLKGYNTTAFEVGDFLFVSPTGTSLTTTPPTSPAYQICVGLVTKKAVDGEVCVNVVEPVHINDITGFNLNRTTLADKQAIIFNGTEFVNRLLGKGDVGLDNVDNTSDLDKPVSTAQQAAINVVDGKLELYVPKEGTQYVFVVADGTDVENAIELQSAYDEAKTLSPSTDNRITVIASPANYNFGTGSFDMDTEFIDLVSLDGNRSVIFNHPVNTSNRTEGSINITANDVFVKGVNVLNKNFTIGDDLNKLKVENCQGGDFSFGGDLTIAPSNPITVSGTFTNCKAGDESFGRFGVASGTFINCTGGVSSFARYGTASGTFTNCIGGLFAFGGFNGTASGTFTNCIGGDFSFAGGMTASGTFTNCVAGNGSFGGSGTLSGKLYRCQLTAGTFQTPTGSGKIVLGIDGNDNVINL